MTIQSPGVRQGGQRIRNLGDFFRVVRKNRFYVWVTLGACRPPAFVPVRLTTGWGNGGRLVADRAPRAAPSYPTASHDVARLLSPDATALADRTEARHERMKPRSIPRPDRLGRPPVSLPPPKGRGAPNRFGSSSGPPRGRAGAPMSD